MNARIVYLLGAYPLWSETFIRRDLASLLEAGLPLDPVSLFPGDTERRSEWPAAVALTEGGSGAESSRSDWTSRLPLSPALRTKISLFRHRALIAALRDRVRQRPVIHIHAEFADLPALIGATVARREKLSYSVGVHARDVYSGKYRADLVFGGAEFITVCNKAAMDTLLEDAPELAPKVRLIHHGIDFRQWAFREGPFRPHQPLRLLFIGRLVPKKGVDVLLRALSRTRMTGYDVELTVYGDGPRREKLESQARSLGVAGLINWSGVIPEEVVRRNLRQFDCVVIPGVQTAEGDRDGIPNVALEAMAAGVPVIGSDVGGMPEILTKRTGWPVPAGDDESLADAICKVRLNPEEADERRKNAHELVRGRFDANRLCRERAALFETILERFAAESK